MKPVVDWRELAARTAEEQDPQKVLDLARELIRALDAESNKQMDHVSASEKSIKKGAA